MSGSKYLRQRLLGLVPNKHWETNDFQDNNFHSWPSVVEIICLLARYVPLRTIVQSISEDFATIFAILSTIRVYDRLSKAIFPYPVVTRLKLKTFYSSQIGMPFYIGKVIKRNSYSPRIRNKNKARSRR